MNKIDPGANRSKFFPNSRAQKGPKGLQDVKGNYLQRTNPTRKKELDSTTPNHAKVEIPNAVKDFSRIKKAVDAAPDVDNSDKIARLKQQIQSGTYSVDYDQLADKILSSEF